MSVFQLSQQQISSYENDGYIIVRNFLSDTEAGKLYKIAMADETMKKNSFDLNDQSGKKTKLTLWYTPGNDSYGLLTRSNRMIDTANEFIGW